MSDLWTEATRDIEGETLRAAVTAARVGVQPVWAFLAAAESETDFGHRLAIASERIDAAVVEACATDTLIDKVSQAVKETLRSEWATVAHTRQAEAAAAFVPPAEDIEVWANLSPTEALKRQIEAYIREAGPVTHLGSDHIADAIRSAPIPAEHRMALAQHFADHLGSHSAGFQREHFISSATSEKVSPTVKQMTNAAALKDQLNRYLDDLRVEATSMTRQHFQHIADSISSAPIPEEHRQALANHFADRLGSTNASFNRDRFIKACGPASQRGASLHEAAAKAARDLQPGDEMNADPGVVPHGGCTHPNKVVGKIEQHSGTVYVWHKGNESHTAADHIFNHSDPVKLASLHADGRADPFVSEADRRTEAGAKHTAAPEPVARWESRSGKHHVTLERMSDGGFGYTHSSGGGGSLGKMNHEEAMAHMQERVDRGEFLPDAAKTPMRRVSAISLDEARKLRILALAVQRYGADSTAAKAALEDANVGWDTSRSDDILAQALAKYLEVDILNQRKAEGKKAHLAALERRLARGPVRGIVINTDKTVIERDINGLNDMQGIVGGLIEPVNLKTGDTMFVNEEGMYLPADTFNSIATDVCGLGGRPDLLLQGIKGNVFIVGPVNRSGDETDVTDAGRRLVLRVKREASLTHTAGDWEPGKVMPSGRNRQCPRCSGGGYDRHGATSEYCKACQGTGVVPSHVKDEQVLERFGPRTPYQRKNGPESRRHHALGDSDAVDPWDASTFVTNYHDPDDANTPVTVHPASLSAEAASGWSWASGMGGNRDDAHKPFKATHTYNPIGWDQFDARPHPGSKRIKPGVEVMMHGKMDPSGHLLHISDAEGNHQTVDKRSLKRRGRKGSLQRQAVEGGPHCPDCGSDDVDVDDDAHNTMRCQSCGARDIPADEMFVYDQARGLPNFKRGSFQGAEHVVLGGGDHTSVEMDSIPTCDICGKKPAVVDGATVHGPWAYMCEDCNAAHGVGLGLGRGQRLIQRKSSIQTEAKDLTYGDLPNNSARSMACPNPHCEDFGNLYSAHKGDYFMMADHEKVRCGSCEGPMKLAREHHHIEFESAKKDPDEAVCSCGFKTKSTAAWQDHIFAGPDTNRHRRGHRRVAHESTQPHGAHDDSGNHADGSKGDPAGAPPGDPAQQPPGNQPPGNQPPGQQPPGDPNQAPGGELQQGAQVSVHFVMPDGTKGDCPATVQSSDGTQAVLAYENGTFSITQQNGAWTDSQGATFTFDGGNSDTDPDNDGDGGKSKPPWAKDSDSKGSGEKTNEDPKKKEGSLHTADGPTKSWKCEKCGGTVERWRGESDVECHRCGAQYNAFGQRLRDDWRGNSSNYDEDMGDMEGFERQHAHDASLQSVSSYYVRRRRGPRPDYGENDPPREGWVGPIRSANQAEKERKAWEDAGHKAEVHPSSPEVRKRVRDWQKSVRERRKGSSLQVDASWDNEMWTEAQGGANPYMRGNNPYDTGMGTKPNPTAPHPEQDSNYTAPGAATTPMTTKPRQQPGAAQPTQPMTPQQPSQPRSNPNAGSQVNMSYSSLQRARAAVEMALAEEG